MPHSKTVPALPSVLSYADFRAYLRDYVAAKQARRASFNVSAWSRQLRLGTRSTLGMVLSGKRNPGPRLERALARDIGMTPAEERHFGALIRLAKAGESPEVLQHLARQVSRARQRAPAKSLTLPPFASVSPWSCVVLMQLVALPDFRERTDWIRARLHFAFSADEIRRTLRALLKAGLLQRDGRGRLRVREGDFETSWDVSDLGIRRFHDEALGCVRQLLWATPPGEREISGTTLVMKRAHLGRAKALMRKFQDDLTSLLESPREGDSVFHFQLAMCPLTREVR